MLKLFYNADSDYGWIIDLDSEVSFHRAVILLSDYFSQTKSPTQWFRISAVLIRHPEYQSLNINVSIQLNNRKILEGIMECVGLENQYTEILRAIDKMDKIGEEGVAKEFEKLNISTIGIQNPKATGGLIIINQNQKNVTNKIYDCIFNYFIFIIFSKY